MADRYDLDRDRDRERSSERDWDRGRDWGRDVGNERYAGDRGREDWDRERWRRNEGREGRPNEGRYGEGRYEDYNQGRRNEEGWGGEHRGYSDRERGDFNTRGDWGRQGSWGNFGNRPDYSREAEWRNRGMERGMEPGRSQSDFGGSNTGRTNLFGTGGGGFGSGFSSYGAGMGNYGGSMGNYGGSSSYGGGMGSNWGDRGRFSGRGPKGWQRSDDRIRDDVNERLTDHPEIDASEVEVSVKNCEVTLSGTVEERHAKRLAEDIAESVSGVKEVHNQIRIQQGQERHQMAGQAQGESGRSSSGTSGRNK